MIVHRNIILKFSYVLQSEKRSAYVDVRDESEKETSEDWDADKLAEVVEKKHGKEKARPTTEIVSEKNNFFIKFFSFRHFSINYIEASKLK